MFTWNSKCINECSWSVLSVCIERFSNSSVWVSNIGSIHPEPGELVTVANNCTKSFLFKAIQIK